MTRYADYNYYKDTYGGDMSETEFAKNIVLATQTIKQHTLNKVDEANIPEEVEMCACMLADSFLRNESSIGKSSESVGKWSISYANGTPSTRANEYTEIINRMLMDCYASDGTPLLYMGV